MNGQTTFVEPLKRPRRKITAPAKIAERIKHLADWYIANKPGVKCITISPDDAYSVRQLWVKRDGKNNGEAECRMAGFHVAASGDLTWRSFDLVVSP